MDFGFACGHTEHLAARRDYPRDEERRNRTVSWPGDVSLMGEHRLNPPASCHPHRRPFGRLFPTGRAARRSVFFACRVFTPSAGEGQGLASPFRSPRQRGKRQRKRLLVVPPAANQRAGTPRPMRRRLPLLRLVVVCIDPTMNPTAAVAVLRSSYSG